ncbi:MAG: arylamine N-acetyltransferase [Bacteroidota bacterium]
MNYTQLQFKKFLKILEIQPRDPSLDALTQIIRSYITTIPFENISKIYYKKKYGLMNIPDLDLYLDGISLHNFGGTCYSNNFYMNRLLDYLGYEVRLCGADMTNPDVHIVNIVSIENRDYLVDVGYAAPFFGPIPLDLTQEYKIGLGSDEYVLFPRNSKGYSELKMFRNGCLKHGYSVKPQARSISEFETVIKASFRESATFLNAILLVQFGQQSSIRIHNFSLIESNKQNFKQIEIKNKEDLVNNILRYFAIPKEIIEESIGSITNFEDAWN